MTNQTILFDPLLPWPILIGLAILCAASLLLAVWKGLSGWALRALAVLVVLAALTSPVYQEEDRTPLSDIVILAEDRSASQGLSDRSDQTARTVAALTERLTQRNNTDLRHVVVSDGDGNSGTTLMSAISQALAEEPRARIAGIVAVSDGQIHDVELAPSLPAPMHLLMTGKSDDWDRRLIVRNAPGFGIIGEPISLTLRIEDTGAGPDAPPLVPVDIAVDGGRPSRMLLPVGQDFDLPVTLEHGGRNVIHFSVPLAEGELTDRNNSAIIQINGVRDRLRVLLVSGQPHPGGRTWRNLLKSDSSVDLVHFTILRPPEKQDGVPVDELSLIAFPTRELFLEKINDFDLIIFDRYKRRGILPSIYLGNVVEYVQQGGAVLVAAGPDFATADSIFRSPLAPILPAAPTARVIEDDYVPAVTTLGDRHPVTAELQSQSKTWGRWLRHIDLEDPSGDVLMKGYEDRPLLILDRVGDGRVALLASDHAWLWSRGYDGGGPQLELLRRLAHWMMKEPELEEEALWAETTGQTMRIIRRSLREDVGPVEIIRPDGARDTVSLQETAPGQYEHSYVGPEIGLYRLTQDDQLAVVGLGPAAPREFENTIATASRLEPVLKSVRGGATRIEEGLPRLRDVRAGRPAIGRGWIGLTPRNAYETRSLRQITLLPPWLVLLLASGFIVMAWLREGRS
jgi:hypothetical protein